MSLGESEVLEVPAFCYIMDEIGGLAWRRIPFAMSEATLTTVSELALVVRRQYDSPEQNRKYLVRSKMDLFPLRAGAKSTANPQEKTESSAP